MSKIINDLFPGHTIIGNKTSPRSGAFEVSINDRLIFSKFKNETFPDEEEIKRWFS